MKCERPVAGRCHASRLTDLDAWHAAPLRTKKRTARVLQHEMQPAVRGPRLAQDLLEAGDEERVGAESLLPPGRLGSGRIVASDIPVALSLQMFQSHCRFSIIASDREVPGMCVRESGVRRLRGGATRRCGRARWGRQHEALVAHLGVHRLGEVLEPVEPLGAHGADAVIPHYRCLSFPRDLRTNPAGIAVVAGVAGAPPAR
jgi:hypothetical protein